MPGMAVRSTPWKFSHKELMLSGTLTPKDTEEIFEAYKCKATTKSRKLRGQIDYGPRHLEVKTDNGQQGNSNIGVGLNGFHYRGRQGPMGPIGGQ